MIHKFYNAFFWAPDGSNGNILQFLTFVDSQIKQKYKPNCTKCTCAQFHILGQTRRCICLRRDKRRTGCSGGCSRSCEVTRPPTYAARCPHSAGLSSAHSQSADSNYTDFLRQSQTNFVCKIKDKFVFNSLIAVEFFSSFFIILFF